MKPISFLLKQGVYVIFFVLVVFLCLFNTAQAGAWVDDWVSSHTSSGPGFYEGSERGYVSFGNFNARWPVQTEYPITVTPPRLKSGCGGIDAYWGGFSYIKDPEWLVKKAEGMLKNSAFIAFDLAIKNMCNPCSDAMAMAEQLANYLNGININECALAKQVVVQRGPDDPSVWSSMANEITQGRSLNPTTGTAKNPTSYKSSRDSAGGISPVDMSQAISDCPKEFTEIYSSGSLIKNISNKTGLGTYEDVLRGFVGDVVVTFDAGSNLPTFQTYDPCPANRSVDLDAFVYGMVQKRPSSDYQCTVDSNNTLLQSTKTNLQNVVDAFKSNSGEPSSNAKNFLNTIPLPVSYSLQTAVMKGSEAVAVNILAEPLAYVFAGEAIFDLFERTDTLVRYGLLAAKKTGVKNGGDPANCKREIVEPAIEYMRTLRSRLWQMRKHAGEQVKAKLQEMAVTAEIAKNEELRLKQVQQETRRTVLTTK